MYTRSINNALSISQLKQTGTNFLLVLKNHKINIKKKKYRCRWMKILLDSYSLKLSQFHIAWRNLTIDHWVLKTTTDYMLSLMEQFTRRRKSINNGIRVCKVAVR